jgi:hypothetical protein
MQLQICILLLIHEGGVTVMQLVEKLCYKPGARGYNFRGVHWEFSLT